MQRKDIMPTGKFALQGILIVFADSRSVRCEAVGGTYIQNNVMNIFFFLFLFFFFTFLPTRTLRPIAR